MSEQNVVLISTIKGLDKYTKSFFDSYKCVGYLADVAKKVEKAMAEYFNVYLPRNNVKEFKLKKYGVGLADSENGKIFVPYSAIENTSSETVARKSPEQAAVPAEIVDSGSLLSLERSRVNFIPFQG